jgi:autotransporter strand-loop-strand O-heptosyltransferase
LLKIPYKPIQPKVSVADIEIPFKDYITISEHTSRKNKYWHNPTGWQDVVDYCTLKGVKVVVCSKEPTTLRGIIDCTGDRPLLNRAKLIQQSKLFIGVSSGLYWLAQATNTPSILISGSTEEMHEYVWKGIRVVTPKSYCSGCINNRLDIPFNDSFDCPSNKNYECSKEISSKQVIIAIKSILGENI